MEYDWREGLDDDPELKQFLADYEAGTLDAKERAKEQKEQQQARQQNLKVEFQLSIRVARYRQSLNQADLAEKLQVSQAAVSKIENANPSLKALVKYADALGCRLTLS